MPVDFADLPLFSGDHVRTIRFESALEAFDFRTALGDAPADCTAALTQLAETAERAGGAVRMSLEDLAACHAPGWSAVLERAWQRLVGRRLEASTESGSFKGDLAAAYLLRGGDRDSAQRSLQRHLRRHPTSVAAWQLWATFEPLRAAARCAFHGGPLLPAASELVDMVDEDELEPVEPWLLTYAWLAHHVSLDEIRAALAAEAGMTVAPATWEAARSFARWLLEAGGQRFESHTPPQVLQARQQLQAISPGTFARYLSRI